MDATGSSGRPWMAVPERSDRHDAAAGGFDDRAFYELMTQEPRTWPTPVEGVRTAAAFTPFDAWNSHAARTDY